MKNSFSSTVKISKKLVPTQGCGYTAEDVYRADQNIYLKSAPLVLETTTCDGNFLIQSIIQNES